MYSRRPLLWMDKVLPSSELDLESNLYMTEIGDGYIDNIIGDLSYIQECFFVIRWPSNDIPLSVNMLSEEERLDTVLRCLRFIFDDEFDIWEEGAETDIDQKILSLRIIERVGTAMVIIYSKSKKIMNKLLELISYVLNSRRIYYQPLYILIDQVRDLTK